MPFLLFFVKNKITSFISLHSQRRGHHVSTVDHSDMLGLGTVWLGFVVELPLSSFWSFS